MYLLMEYDDLQPALLKGGVFTFGSPNVCTCEAGTPAAAVTALFRSKLQSRCEASTVVQSGSHCFALFT